AHDRRAVQLFLTVSGGDHPVANVNQRDVARYVSWRRSRGDTRSGTKQGSPIGPRVIQYDVALLRAMTRSAVGAALLERNPLEGVRVALGRAIHQTAQCSDPMSTRPCWRSPMRFTGRFASR